MTPAARYAGAIDVLDRMQDGITAERALTAWGRENRYAGSKDRAAVRDHVFSVLRQKRSVAHLGGSSTPRGMVLGLLRAQGVDPDTVFGAGGYAPDALTALEQETVQELPSDAVAHDLPDWLWPIWESDLGDDASTVARTQQSRAPITLRVNLRQGTREAAMAELLETGIKTEPVFHSKTALQVIENERRVLTSNAYLSGKVELQDFASQNAVAGLKLKAGGRVLDYCAGGGGKALAIADAYDVDVFAHDIAPERTVDISARAMRAGVKIHRLLTDEIAKQEPFNLVFCDAPCTGSGTWRRTPEAKWALDSEKLLNFSHLQLEVIQSAARYVCSGGQLVYATCSVLRVENDDVVSAFLSANSGWTLLHQDQRLPDRDGDGFYFALLQKP